MDEWVLRGLMAERGLTVERAWAGVVAEWHAAGIPFDRSRGYHPEVVDVSVDELGDVVERHMAVRASEDDRLTAPATAFQAQHRDGSVEYMFACWDVLPEGWD